MKKVISSFLSLVIIITSICVFPIGSFAGENDKNFTVTFDSNDVYSASKFSSKFMSESPLTKADIELIRDTVVQRLPSCEIEINSGSTVRNLRSYLLDAFYTALSYDYSKTNIDFQYALYQFDEIKYQASYSNGVYDVEYTFAYRTDADKEIAVNNVIKSFFSSIDLNNISDYDLVKRIHDFVLDSCEYSKDFDKDSVYTAWGALCDGDSVCQGYALAFYRLCKEAGLDVVIDVSDPYVGCHAWNIVKLGGKSYYVDCTWDDSTDSDTYFLVNYNTLTMDDSWYGEHTHYAEQSDYDYINENYISLADSSSYWASSNSISNCTINLDYNGNVLSVKDKNGNTLTNGVDYDVTNDSNSFVKINGKGRYFGSSERKKSISGSGVNMKSSASLYKGYAKPQLSIYPYVLDNDYAVYYFNNDKLGTATAMACGMGKYTGFCQVDFDVVKGNINDFSISLSYDGVLYDGSEKKPGVYVDGLDEGVDYTVSYSNNVEEGTATVSIEGIGNYEGTATRNFYIFKYDISDKTIVLGSSSFEYTGSEIKPNVTVFGCTEGVDYVLSYSNNVNVGTASVTVTGIGSYRGSKTLNFMINDKMYLPDLPIAEQSTQATSSTSQSTTAAKTSQSTAFSEQSTTQTNKSSKPKKVKISKLKSGKKALTVYWKKVSSSGYQIQYGTNKKFKKAKKITVKPGKTTSKKIKKLKSGKKYYVRIRAFKTQNGKKVYGSWSSVKSIKVK